jgi:chloramphenicol 3-O-phosphotransferase
MIDKDRINAEAEAFFDWPGKEKTHVTTTSMLIFANVIAEMARAEEREACAALCDAGVDMQHPAVTNHVMRNFGPSNVLAQAIRLRHNHAAA